MRNTALIALVSLAAALLLSSGCATDRGPAIDGNYVSPAGNFTVPVPGGVGLRIQDHFENDLGAVAFHDDLGNYKGIFYLRLPPDFTDLRDNPVKHRGILVRFLNEFAMPNLFEPASPRARVLYREHVDSGDGGGYFAIVELPEGSTLFDAQATKRYDTMRGVLIFMRGEFMYVLSTGENPSVLGLGQPPMAPEELVKFEKRRLLEFKTTITFR